MATELLTFASEQTDAAIATSPLRGLKSRQAPTLRQDGFGFGDFLDLINPLNYIPILSDIYQHATATKASPVSSLIGGALLGGPVGMAVAGINAVFEAATGKGALGSIAQAVTGEKTEAGAAKQVAQYRQLANAHKPDHELSFDV